MKAISAENQKQIRSHLASKAMDSKKIQRAPEAKVKDTESVRAQASQIHLSRELKQKEEVSQVQEQLENVKVHQKEEIKKIQADLRESLSESGFEVRLADMKDGDMSLEIVDKTGHVVAKIPPKEAFEIIKEASEKNKSSRLEGQVLDTNH